MAGNWIKIEHITPDKPEIVAMAQALGIDQDSVFGKCIRVWIWADQQTVAGDDLPVTPSFIDRLTNCPGFSDCLIKIGWLKSRSGRFSIPHFDRHNGQTAKNRALITDRVKRLRNGQSVTKPLPDKEGERSPIVPLNAWEVFETFRKAYPGRKRGDHVEYAHFLAKHKARAAEILPLLLPAAKAYATRCDREGTELQFRKHLKTWINNECWTEESPAPSGKPKQQSQPDDYLLDSEMP
jgi:hypothetical protein